MKQITEDYVSFETAKLLKEKGFNEEVRTFYNSNGKFEYCSFPLNHNLDIGSGFVSAPTQSLALKWLREVHKFIVTIDYDRYPVDNGENNIVGYGYNIQTKDNPEDYYRISESVYDSYEEAVEVALLYTLKNLI